MYKEARSDWVYGTPNLQTRTPGNKDKTNFNAVYVLKSKQRETSLTSRMEVKPHGLVNRTRGSDIISIPAIRKGIKKSLYKSVYTYAAG